MAKVSFAKDQRAKAQELNLPLVAVAFDGQYSVDKKDKYRMDISGPVPPKFKARFKKFMNDFIKAMADRNVDKA